MEDPGQISLSEVQDTIHQLDKNEPGARPLLQDPARQIRLFTLWPGTQESAIQGVFSVATLDDEPDYQCISYVWGDASDIKDITVDGKDFKITTSLFSVLRRIRSEKEYLTVWADALCINQDDHEEKRVQVDMMFDIYSKCSNCFFWLGEVDLLDGELSLETVRYGLDFIEFLDDKGREDDTFSTGEGMRKLCLAFRSLVECQWWWRIWTIQECVAPRTAIFLWGPFSISRPPVMGFGENSLRELLATNRWTNGKGKQRDYVAFLTLTSLVNRLSSLRLHMELGYPQAVAGEACTGVLWSVSAHQASDPRDKIFALLPFISGALTSVKSSNYDIDCFELYSRVTVDLIRSSQSLLPLMGRWESETPSEEPSWVLDWRRFHMGEFQEGETWASAHRLNQQFDASHGIPEMDMQDLVSGDGRRLTLRGYFIDELVNAIKPPVSSSSGPDDPEDYYPPHTSLRFLMKFWEYIVQEGIFDNPQELGVPLIRKESIAHLSELWNVMKKTEKDPLPPPGSDPLQIDDHAWMLGWLLSRIMAVFLVSAGRFGIGTLDVKKGDEVWILCSGHMPFILRPIIDAVQQGNDNGHVEGSEALVLPGKHKRYRLVSECYMPGMMNGELSSAGNSMLRTITLC